MALSTLSPSIILSKSSESFQYTTVMSRRRRNARYVMHTEKVVRMLALFVSDDLNENHTRSKIIDMQKARTRYLKVLWLTSFRFNIM